jgi:hypothetical protein
MKKRAMVSMVVALGLLVGSSAYAAACGSCGDSAKCKDSQTVQQFKSETGALANELQAKDMELRNEFALEGINPNRKSGPRFGLSPTGSVSLPAV